MQINKIHMLVLIFLLSFNQSALWGMKDSLVITAMGAEIIPFIKVWAILPGSILFTFIYTQLSNRFNQEKIFHFMMSGFLLFFALFAFVLYPYSEQLHPHASANYLENVLPDGFKGLITMFRYWTFSSFYVVCELWNTVMISVLFWRFANQTTQSAHAPRFYSLLSFSFSLAMMAAGATTALIIPIEGKDWNQTLIILTSIIIFNGFLSMQIFRQINHKVPCVTNRHAQEKLTLRQCVRHVSRSRHLLYIAIIVVAYSLVINLAELVWKDQVKVLYPEASDYNLYISYLQIGQGALAIVCSLGMALIMKRIGWKNTALITPVIMLMCCLAFFGILLFQDHFQFLLFGISPLVAIVFFGSLQNCISKGCKYSLFDSTKEMALLSLSDESQFKGKTVIDGIGVRFGKSGSSLIHQGLLIGLSSVAATAPYVGGVLLIAILFWMLAVCKLGQKSELQSI